MFWFELVARAAELVVKSSSEAVVKSASEHAAKDVLSAKRHLAKKLFSYYEKPKQYRALCDNALLILQTGHNWVFGGLTFGASKELGAVSDKMKRIGGDLFVTLFTTAMKSFQLSAS